MQSREVVLLALLFNFTAIPLPLPWGKSLVTIRKREVETTLQRNHNSPSKMWKLATRKLLGKRWWHVQRAGVHHVFLLNTFQKLPSKFSFYAFCTFAFEDGSPWPCRSFNSIPNDSLPACFQIPLFLSFQEFDSCNASYFFAYQPNGENLIVSFFVLFNLMLFCRESLFLLPLRRTHDVQQTIRVRHHFFYVSMWHFLQ